MPLVNAKCTNCGANLTVDSTKDAAVCEYCGSAYIVEKAIQNYNITNNIHADVVNIYGGNSADFVIRAGTLEKYNGAATDVIIPNSVTVIGREAFSGCIGLTSVIIPDSVTVIGGKAFEHCTGLTSVTIPNGVTKIVIYAFHGCTGLTSITIPNSVTEIGIGAFWGCTGLTSVVIPDSVTEIGERAFRGCTGLTSVTIPNGATRIAGDAFPGTCKINQPNKPQPNEPQPNESQPNKPQPKQSTGGCYIATAVYGSYDCPQVWTLRRFRDNKLAQTRHGRLFIKIYYALSPTAVKLFGKTTWFQNFWRGRLDKFVRKLQQEGVESTPYQDSCILK